MIRTPQTDPDHAVIGRYFMGVGDVYYCDSYDPSCGFWMTCIEKDRRTNVSERAIGRTYHRIYEDAQTIRARRADPAGTRPRSHRGSSKRVTPGYRLMYIQLR